MVVLYYWIEEAFVAELVLLCSLLLRLVLLLNMHLLF